MGTARVAKIFRKEREEVINLCVLCASFAALREGNIRGNKTSGHEP
jgi:hypothetical protein